MLATFRSAMTSEPAEENGVKGCVLAELGRVAEFEGADGRLASVEITEALIVSLVALASADGRLDAYWTHDRLRNTDADSIHDSVGVWRNFRRNERGDMIADIDLEPSAHREKILWKAKNDKQGIMTSLVFEYEGGGVMPLLRK